MRSTNLPPGSGIIALYTPDNVTAHSGPGLTEVNQGLQPELERLETANAEAEAHFAERSATLNRLREVYAERSPAFAALQYEILTECVDSPCPNFALLASRQAAPEAELTVLQNGIDLLVHQLLPNAQEHFLVTRLDLARARHLEASLLACIEQAETLRRTESAFPGVRAITINETVLALEAEAKELERRASDAARNLEEFRTKREAQQQARMIGGKLTRAEAVFASVQMQQERDNEQ